MEDLPNYLTVRQFVAKHSAFTIGGLRCEIFNAETNGLQESGALSRVNRKILINERIYLTGYIPSKNKKVLK